jgi:hypothetical protein
MIEDTKNPIDRLADRLFSLPLGNYLLSENFSLFCRQHNLEDIWKEYRVVSRDRPELYGIFVIKNAFVLFLQHILHSRPNEFPEVFTHFLSGFSREISQPLPLDDLKKDLMDLGYSDNDLDKKFSVLRVNGEEHRERRTTGCPD